MSIRVKELVVVVVDTGLVGGGSIPFRNICWFIPNESASYKLSLCCRRCNGLEFWQDRSLVFKEDMVALSCLAQLWLFIKVVRFWVVLRSGGSFSNRGVCKFPAFFRLPSWD
jgi:hypothetical protein